MEVYKPLIGAFSQQKMEIRIKEIIAHVVALKHEILKDKLNRIDVRAVHQISKKRSK